MATPHPIFSLPPGGMGLGTCQPREGKAPWLGPPATPQQALRRLPCSPHQPLTLGPVILAHASQPPYLTGSSGGQAGGHVSVWDSRASMSLSRSVCTLAPATANEDGQGGGHEGKRRAGPHALVSFPHRS